jgi:hypothetical protein
MGNEAKAEAIRELEVQIRINELLPPNMKCFEAIAEMKAKLRHLKRYGSLRLVEER